MGKIPQVDDGLWRLSEPLLPARPPAKGPGGRPRHEDRKCLDVLIFVLRSGVAWNAMPTEAGRPSGITAWRRLCEWQEAGVWERLHRLLLERLRESGKVDFSRVSVDSSIVRAIGAGEKDGPKRRAPRKARHQAPLGRGRPRGSARLDRDNRRPQ
jgi:transposase